MNNKLLSVLLVTSLLSLQTLACDSSKEADKNIAKLAQSLKAKNYSETKSRSKADAITYDFSMDEYAGHITIDLKSCSMVDMGYGKI